MARTLNRLSARSVSTIKKHGRHADGGGLYLVIGPGASRRWTFLYRRRGRLREMGLGSAAAVSLSDARQKAAEQRRLLADGRDPIETRQAKETVGAANTFGVFADELLVSLMPGFSNERHRQQWQAAITDVAAPLRRLRLDEITTSDVLAVLQPIWLTKHETASRVRGRIERVLDAAKAKGLRSGENPARWRGHLNALLPARQKLTHGHHTALPYQEVPAFIARLRASESIAALALEFLILTAARAGEVLGARWDEFDLGAQLWTVPGQRMKSRRAHRVPLAERSQAILEVAAKVRTSDLVFPGARHGRPLRGTTIARLASGGGDATVHGFRSSFRDWAGETTAFPREIIEAALAHVVGSETERAYARGDVLQKRRELMDAWARFIERTPANVVSLSGRAKQ